jgi:serine/threonine protein kinase
LSSILDDEIKILGLIEAQVQVPAGGALIPRVVFARDDLCYFGMTPVGSALTTELFRRHHVSQLCATLKAMHSHGFVHRDIRVRNLALVPEKVARMLDQQSQQQLVSSITSSISSSDVSAVHGTGSAASASEMRVMILDFGCSQQISSGKTKYSGAFVEASRDVHSHLLSFSSTIPSVGLDDDVKNQDDELAQFEFRPADDLESLVYTVFAICFPQALTSQLTEVISTRQRSPDSIRRVQQFWARTFGVEVDDMSHLSTAASAADDSSDSSAGANWRKALRAARRGDHDAVETRLLQAIPFLGI